MPTMPSPLNCSTARKLGPGWGLVAALGVALVLVACDPFATGSVGVSVLGSVVNTSGRGVDDATVNLVEGESAVRTADVGSDGRFIFDNVDRGDYTVQYRAPGYPDSSFEISAQETRRLGADTLTGSAQIEGTIADAQTGEPVAGATVTLAIEPEESESQTARQKSAQEATRTHGADLDNPDFETQTGDSGNYEISGVPTGTGTRSVESDGYETTRTSDVEIGAGENAIGTTGIPEELEGDGFRIVMEWGESPADLDAHLTGPTGEGERFHAAYFRRAPTGTDAELDQDISTGYGPETITVQSFENGIYRYSVHNFSDPSRGGAMGFSTAQVRVYDSDGQFATYTPPSADPGDGNAWRVFEIVASDGELTVDDGNGDTLGFFFADGPGDVTTFSRSENGAKPVLSQDALDRLDSDMR